MAHSNNRTTTAWPELGRRGFMNMAAGAGLAAAGGGLGFGLGLDPAFAKAPMLGTYVPGWYRFKIGDFEATIVSDGLLDLGKATDQFPAAPASDIEAIMQAEFLPMAPMMLEQNCLILNTGDKLVLFDSGMGMDKMFGPSSGRLLKSISAAGIDPATIDAIVLTHAHCDHCWGIMADDGTRNFPNAQIYISQADYDFWTDESKLSADGFVKTFVAGARKNLVPNRDRMIFVEDGKEVLPGIQAISSPGHTIGHMSYVITSGDAAFLNVGDVVHHYALLFENPGWEFAFDSDPKLAAKTRLKVFDMAVSEKLPLIGYHFPFPGLGNIRREGSGFEYVPIPVQHG